MSSMFAGPRQAVPTCISLTAEGQSPARPWVSQPPTFWVCAMGFTREVTSWSWCGEAEGWQSVLSPRVPLRKAVVQVYQ